MIPNLLSEVDACKRDYPVAWAAAHTGSAQTDDFILLLATRCHALDSRFGNNGKRGNPADISDDALCFKGEGTDFVDVNGVLVPATVIDVIGAAGTPAAVAQWMAVSNPNAPIRTAWVQPRTPAPPPPPPAPTIPSYEDLGGDEWHRVHVGVLLEADMALAGQRLNDGSSVWFARTIYECLAESVKAGHVVDRDPIVKKYRTQWRAILGLPPL